MWWSRSSPPLPFWIPAFAGKTRRAVVPGFSIAVLTWDFGSWIPAPYRGTGQALRGNDEWWGGVRWRVAAGDRGAGG